jgi:hypothetical protein
MLNQLWEAFSIGYGLWGTFGIFFGAISIFNLISKAYHLGLAPIIQDLVKTYQWTFHTVLLNPIWQITNFTPPAWLNDSIIIWFSGAAISYRTLLAARNYFYSEESSNHVRAGKIEMNLFHMPIWKYYLITAIVSFIMWPVLWVRYLYSEPLQFREEYPMTLAYNVRGMTYRKVWLIQILSIATLIGLLLITSAGLPTSN